MAGPHPMVEHFKFVAAHTKRTPKITIPAPSAIYGRPMMTPIDKQVYPDMDQFFDDLGKAYKKAVRGFADAGCRYLQLDEVFIAMLCDPKYREQMTKRGDDPEKLGPLYADLINAAMSDIPADMTITMHLCRGNYKSTFMGAGGYDAEAEVLFNQHQRARLFHGVRHRARRRLRAAALRAQGQDRGARARHHQDRPARIQGRRSSAASTRRRSSVRSINSALSPQCGFASTEEGNALTEDEQWAKLRMIVEVADEVWGLSARLRTTPPSSPGLTRRSIDDVASNSGKSALEARSDPRVKPGGDAERVERAEKQ